MMMMMMVLLPYVVCLSVRPSVTFEICDHIGWVESNYVNNYLTILAHRSPNIGL